MKRSHIGSILASALLLANCVTQDGSSSQHAAGNIGTKTSALAAGVKCFTAAAGDSLECDSGYCVKGPPPGPCSTGDARYYCTASPTSCPRPGSAGVADGVEYNDQGLSRAYVCDSGQLKLAHGEICNDMNDPNGLPCASGRCLPGPRGANYCTPTGFDCARPRDLGLPGPHGINQGEGYLFDGGNWRCDGQSIVPVCSQTPCAGVSNGFICLQNSDCSSNKCRPGPGPDNQLYCVDSTKDCPQPMSYYLNQANNGVSYGVAYSYLGRQWICSAAAQRLLDLGPLDHLGYGAQSWTGSNPVGGGPGYTSYVDPNANGTVIANTADSLRLAIDQANSNGGGQVYIPGDAQINLSDIAWQLPLVLQDGVTVGSNRGQSGSPGALVYIDPNPNHPGTQHLRSLIPAIFVFQISGENSRITGLRLRGTDPHYRFERACHPLENGILVAGAKARIDNCEIAQWNYRAIQVENAGTKSTIAHNYIHHSRRHSLGYGINVTTSSRHAHLAGTAKITANIIDWGRHAIAGGGIIGTRYRAAYNIFGETFRHYTLDMHDGAGNPDLGGMPGIAGTQITVVSNSFYDYDANGAINIGGRPQKMSTIRKNHFNAIHRLGSASTSQRRCPHPYGAKIRSETMLVAPEGSCAVSQFSVDRNHFSEFENLNVYDNRHANDPTTCLPTASCSYDWACGTGACVAGSCVCP